MRITPDMRVSEVLREYPASYAVFQRNGCPEMRRGFFSLMARLMKLRWAATVHRIPLQRLVDELNECANAGAGDQERAN
jgi:hypothetical protein